MRAAVVGLGWWGKVIVKNLAKSDKINVVCGVDQDLSNSKNLVLNIISSFATIMRRFCLTRASTV